eukprot:scaffold6026_cov163-Amphora_coffeaeformis.AAC.5
MTRLTRQGSFYPLLRWMFLFVFCKSSAFLRPVRRLRLSYSLSSDTDCPSCQPTSTRYTIDTPPIDPELLQSTVRKSFANFDRYLESRPVAAHTLEAFGQFQEELAKSPTFSGLILDSGCGTGRSSLVLGDLYQDKMIVGVDRSIVRLGRIARDLTSWTDDELDDSIEEAKIDKEDSNRQHVQRVRDNVILVRAELVHFWRLWWQSGLVEKTEQHYMLYPNPYPKKSRLKQRWYAHPSFPLLLLVTGGKPLILRTNWRQYAQEFADAVTYAGAYEDVTEDGVSSVTMNASKLAQSFLCSAKEGPRFRNPGDPWTNFEAKYDKIGEATYQLCLQTRD